MKKIVVNIYTSIVFLAIISLTAGCQKDVPVTETPLSISVEKTYADAAEISVTQEAATATYYFNVIERTAYSTDEGIIERDLEYFNAKAKETGKELSYVINSELSVGSSRKTIEGLKPETAYFAYAYNLNNDGTAGTTVTKAEFRTEAHGSVNSMFQIDIKDIYAYGATVSVKASEAGTLFYTTTISESAFRKHCTDDEKLGTYMVDEIRRAAENQNVEIEKMVEIMARKDQNTFYYQTLSPENEYYACVVSINEKAEVLAAPEYKTFKTTAAEPVSGNFEVTFSEITTYTAQYLMTPQDPAMLYYMGIFKVSDVDKYKNDEEFMRTYIEQAGFLFPMLLSQGESEGINEDLLPDTEYYVIAFGTDETTYTTELFKAPFCTQVGSPLEEFNVQIDILEVASTEMKCEMYPTSTDYRYMYDALPSYYYKEGFNEKDLQEYVNVITDYYMAVMPDLSLEDILKLYLSGRGNNRITFRNLAPDLDYYVWAAAIDMDGNILSDYNMIKVHTKKAVDGQGKAEIELADVFKGDDVAQLLPDIFYGAEGSAVAIFNATLSYVEKEWVYCVFEGDLSKYEDDLCITNLMEQGTFTTPETNRFAMKMKWETDYTILAMAKDKNGDWGALTRYPVNISKDFPITPISEFPMDMFYGPAPENCGVKQMISKKF